jgi:excisionase family DNA binding protein
MQPRLLTGQDAARYLGISMTVLDDLVHRSELIPRRLGGKRQFRREDLDAYIDRLPEWETKKSESSERVAS